MSDVGRELSPVWVLDSLTKLERRLTRFFEFVDEYVCAKIDPRITPVQAVLVMRIPEGGCTIKEITLVGAYNGSNVSYNVKHLEEAGYIDYFMRKDDRRSRFVRRTDKGNQLQKAFATALSFEKKGRDVVRIFGIDREVPRGLE